MTAPAAEVAPLRPRTRVPVGEKWHYTSQSEVEKLYREAVAAPQTSLPRPLVDLLAGPPRGSRFVYVNGRADVGLGWQPAPDGVHALPGGLRIDPDVVVEEPLQIVFVTVPGERLGHTTPTLDVEVGARSKVTIVESYTGMPGPAVITATTRVQVDSSANVELVRLQQASYEAVHIGATEVSVAADATVHLTAVSLGGRIGRHELTATLAGNGARFELDGLYLPIGSQRHDTVVTVDHAASHTSSTQNVRGVVDDRGRGSFTGHVIVQADTVGTDAKQSNRNLVLVPTAEADTRPWLEIHADDVKCTHGATVGRLDDDALFYLRSRGIPQDEARGMLIEAFTAGVLAGVGDEGLREHLASVVRRHRDGEGPE